MLLLLLGFTKCVQAAKSALIRHIAVLNLLGRSTISLFGILEVLARRYCGTTHRVIDCLELLVLDQVHTCGLECVLARVHGLTRSFRILKLITIRTELHLGGM